MLLQEDSNVMAESWLNSYIYRFENLSLNFNTMHLIILCCNVAWYRAYDIISLLVFCILTKKEHTLTTLSLFCRDLLSFEDLPLVFGAICLEEELFSSLAL